jgi:hypothetical protein
MPSALLREACVPGTVTLSPTSDPYVNGVLGGTKWAVDSFTFSFPTSPSEYGKAYGFGEAFANFQAFNSAQQDAVHSILDLYASAADLTFTEINEISTQHATIRFAESDKPSTAWAYYPSSGAEAGDAWFRHSYGLYDNPIKGTYAWLTILHETGHTLGLKHPQEAQGYFRAMPADHDSLEFTVMSYRSYVGAPRTAYTNGTWSYPQTLMMYDIAGLQTLYGANYQTNSGATTYQWNADTGEMSINGVGQGAPAGNRIFMTIWDGGGHDTFDYSNYSTNITVDLQPGGWSTLSTVQLASLGYGHTARGNVANALLYHNNPASLIEDAIGGSGNDTIIGNIADNKLVGGQGNDFLDGGAGADTAAYSGDSHEYSWSLNSDGSWTVADLRAGSPDGTDTLDNIQYLDFTDLLVELGVIDTGDGNQNGENSAPVALNDFYATNHQQLSLDVLANDIDVDADGLSTVLVKGPGRGKLHLNDNGDFVYTPPKHFTGTVKFSYMASDGLVESDIATVRIKVGHKASASHKFGSGAGVDDFDFRRSTLHHEHEHGRSANFDITHDQAPPLLGYDESHYDSGFHLDHANLLFGSEQLFVIG